MDMQNARKEKLMQLKQLMYELMSEEGIDMDSTMPAAKVTEMVATLEEEPDDEMESDDSDEMEESAMEMDEDGTPTLAAMKKSFFKPRAMPEKAGPSAMIIAGQDVPDMKPEIEKAMPSSGPMRGKSWLKKGKYA